MYDRISCSRGVKRRLGPVVRSLLLATFALGSLGAVPALAAGPPVTTTVAASNVATTTATLNGKVDPSGTDTTYHFQYGTSTAYGAVTPTAGPIHGNGPKPVSAAVAALAPNTTYHFRLVAVNTAGTSNGADVAFHTLATIPPSTNAVSISASPAIVKFGGTATIAGKVTGPKSAGLKVTLEQNPAPYTGGFKTTTVTGITNVAGQYSLSIRPALNTRYRVTVKTMPKLTSAPVLVAVRVRVGLRLSDSTPRVGQRVRFSGFVTPAHNGKFARIQRRTSSGAWHTIATATLVAATPAGGVARSKFSKRIRIRHTATYRVRVAPNDGDHLAGNSRRVRATVH